MPEKPAYEADLHIVKRTLARYLPRLSVFLVQSRVVVIYEIAGNPVDLQESSCDTSCSESQEQQRVCVISFPFSLSEEEVSL